MGTDSPSKSQPAKEMWVGSDDHQNSSVLGCSCHVNKGDIPKRLLATFPVWSLIANVLGSHALCPLLDSGFLVRQPQTAHA